MEIIPSGIISSISNSLCSYCLEHLKHYQQLVHVILLYITLHLAIVHVYIRALSTSYYSTCNPY